MGRGPRAELRVGNSGPSLRVALAPTSQRSLGPTVTGGQCPVWGTRASQSHRDLSPPSAQHADCQVPEERCAGCTAPPPSVLCPREAGERSPASPSGVGRETVSQFRARFRMLRAHALSRRGGRRGLGAGEGAGEGLVEVFTVTLSGPDDFPAARAWQSQHVPSRCPGPEGDASELVAPGPHRGPFHA